MINYMEDMANIMFEMKDSLRVGQSEALAGINTMRAFEKGMRTWVPTGTVSLQPCSNMFAPMNYYDVIENGRVIGWFQYDYSYRDQTYTMALKIFETTLNAPIVHWDRAIEEMIRLFDQFGLTPVGQR